MRECDLSQAERQSRESLAALARGMNLPTTTVEALILTGMQWEAQNREEACKNAGISFEVAMPWRRILEARTVWDALFPAEQWFRDYVSTELVKYVPYDWINYTHLTEIARCHNLPVPVNQDVSSLSRFLGAIPIGFLFTNTFNAFLSQGSPARKLPAIYIHHLIYPAVEFLIHLLSHIIFIADESGLHQRPSIEALKLIKSPEMKTEFGRAFELLCGKAIGIRHENYFGATRPALLWLSYCSAAAQDFVIAHEVAHLLQGHLDIGACHYVELQADLFAAYTLSRQSEDNSTGSKANSFGTAALFAAFAVIEAINNSNFASHPPAPWRTSSWRAPPKITRDIVICTECCYNVLILR